MKVAKKGDLLHIPSNVLLQHATQLGQGEFRFTDEPEVGVLINKLSEHWEIFCLGKIWRVRPDRVYELQGRRERKHASSIC